MTTLEADLHDADALQLGRGGRRFPQTWSRSASHPANRVRKLAEPPHEVELPAQVEAALWDQLAWADLLDSEQQRPSLVEAYVRSLNQLDGFRRDVGQLVRAASLVNLEFRQAAGATHEQARDVAMNAKLDEMLAAASADWFPTLNVLDGNVASKTESDLREQLSHALRAAVHQFVENFFAMLARLVDRQLVGLVEWLPNHCCSYHFFKQVVIQENEGATRRVNESTSKDPELAFTSERIGTRTTTVTKGKGTHHHRLARHEHTVINAVRTSIRNTRVVMPPQVEALLEQVPEWLYPFVAIIDGDIVRERIIERETKVEHWQDVVIQDEPIYGCEPGVIIGPYVLTGWGPREVAAEQGRRSAQRASAELVQTQQVVAWRAPCFAAAAAAMAILALVLLAGSLRGHGGSLLTLLATGAAIGAAWQAVFDFLTARNGGAHAANAAHWFTASIGCQLLIALWLVARAFGPLSWSIPIILGIVAVVCYAAGRRLC